MRLIRGTLRKMTPFGDDDEDEKSFLKALCSFAEGALKNVLRDLRVFKMGPCGSLRRSYSLGIAVSLTPKVHQFGQT